MEEEPTPRKRVSKNAVLIVLSLLVLALLFYWFQFKPSQIRQSCYWETKGKIASAQNEGKRISGTQPNNWYRVCLVRNGMKAEDLITN